MKIAVFEAGLPNSGHDAGSTAIVELCALATEMGHDVQYVYTGDNAWGRTHDLLAGNIPFIRFSEAGNAAKSGFIKKSAIDVALISRPGPAAQWLPVCGNDNIPVVYFGHDIHHVRMALGNEFLSGSMQASTKNINIMRIMEQNIWRKSAAVIYPLEEECDIVQNYCGKNHALAMPIYDLSLAYENFCKAPDAGKDGGLAQLLFVGGAHHMPNHDGVMWFAAEVMPHIKQEFALNIIGAWPEKIRAEIIKTWNENAGEKQLINFCGLVPQEELYVLYKQAKLVIAPLRFGAGVKRKVVEALAFRLPVVGTGISFEGVSLGAFGEYFLCETDGKKFAAKIQLLLNSDSLDIKDSIEKFAAGLVEKYSNSYRSKVLEKALGFI